MKLCEAEGFAASHDLLAATICDSVCPAICMTEGCDYTTEMEPDQAEGYCEACGGNTVVSVLVLAWDSSEGWAMLFRNFYRCDKMRLAMDRRVVSTMRR